MEGRLKGVMEKADREKALKKVAESILNEKILKLAITEWRATLAERARELVDQKMEAL